MDEELKNLEAELRRLRPRAPSRELVARIERDLTAVPAKSSTASVTPAASGEPLAPPRAGARVYRFDWRWAALALPAAAALAVGLFLATRPASENETKSQNHAFSSPAIAAGEPTSEPPLAATSAATPDPDDRLKPIAAENILFSARDEGLVTLDDGTPARQERLQYVDTITWKNPRTNASLTMSVPREEVRIVPVRFQ